MTRNWFIRHGNETLSMDACGLVTYTGMPTPSGSWHITGAVERNNFGHVTARLTLSDVKDACNSLDWQYKNGKQRIFLTDLDHGTAREWRSPKHSVYSTCA